MKLGPRTDRVSDAWQKGVWVIQRQRDDAILAPDGSWGTGEYLRFATERDAKFYIHNKMPEAELTDPVWAILVKSN